MQLGFDLEGTEELIPFGNYIIEKPETEEYEFEEEEQIVIYTYEKIKVKINLTNH